MPENLSDENKKSQEALKQYLFGDAAMNYFDNHLRIVLEKQVEMIELNENTPFDADFVYPKNILIKYVDMLDEDDPLSIRYKKSQNANALSISKELGLF
jgi:hypothetical protein